MVIKGIANHLNFYMEGRLQPSDADMKLPISRLTCWLPRMRAHEALPFLEESLVFKDPILLNVLLNISQVVMSWEDMISVW